MSPNQGRKPTSGSGGGGGSAARPPSPAAVRRFALLVFGASLVLLFAIVAIAQGIGNPSVPSGDVAIVEEVPGDGGTISEERFERALEQAAAQAGLDEVPKPGDEQYENLKEAALNGLFDIAWVQGQAEEMGISASDRELEEELETIKEQNFENPREYREFLKESRFNEEDVNERLRVQVLSVKIQERLTGETPSPSGGEVKNYYEAAKDTQFTRQASRDVRVILNGDRKKIDRVKAQLDKDSSQKAWNRLARRLSEDEATKENGGLQEGVVEGALEEPLNAEVFGTPESRLGGPLETERGFYVFEVQGTTPEEVQSLGDVEAQIESQLEQQAQQEEFAAFVAGFGSKWTSRTFCVSDFTTERCANFEGDGPPETAPPGCYEADPEGGRPEACPAPVFQLIPALPGTVTPLEPRGTPMAQRPHPAAGQQEGEEAPFDLGGAGVPPPAQ